MKHQDEKQSAGVWVDHEKALIITKESGDYVIKQKIAPPGDFVAESELHINNAKSADMRSYFKSLSGHLQQYDQILLLGTGKSQEQFKNYLNEDAKFQAKEITIENTDKLSDHQMIAKVRNFFH